MWDRGRDNSGRGLKDGHIQLCHIARKGSGRLGLAERMATGADYRIVSCQCASGVVLQHRELLRHVETGVSGLSWIGAAKVAEDMLGRRVFRWDVRRLDVRELLEHAHPALFDETIGSPLLAPVSADERARWRLARGV